MEYMKSRRFYYACLPTTAYYFPVRTFGGTPGKFFFHRAPEIFRGVPGFKRIRSRYLMELHQE